MRKLNNKFGESFIFAGDAVLSIQIASGMPPYMQHILRLVILSGGRGGKGGGRCGEPHDAARPVDADWPGCVMQSTVLQLRGPQGLLLRCSEGAS